MNDLLRRLGLPAISPLFDKCCAEALAEPGIPVWLTEAFLLETARELPVLTTNLETVVSALPKVLARPDLVLFAKTLHRMLGIRAHHETVFPGLVFPKPPAGEDPIAWDLFSLYPMLARVREAYEGLARRGIPKDLLHATAAGVDGSISASFRRAGRPAFIPLYFLWCTTHSNGSLLRLNRFNYEIRENMELPVRAFVNGSGEIALLMREGSIPDSSGRLLYTDAAQMPTFRAVYRETADGFEGNPVDPSLAQVERNTVLLPRTLWKPLYQPGDPLISIHIPKGEPLTEALVESSLKEAAAFYQAHFPDKRLQAFMCISWLMAPELRELLKPESNILPFGARFSRFPVPSQGTEVFNFVFSKVVDTLSPEFLDTLPENTSLQRAMKDFYRQGNILPETGGLLPFSKLSK